jgi:hypothetical protein
MDADPRELSTGYIFPRGKGVAAYAGVLRDGRRVTWQCTGQPGHRLHLIPAQAQQCAEAELERRLQGAQEVLRALYCKPCGVFWDLGWLSRYRPAEPPEHDIGHWLARGACPRCTGPADRVKIAVLERQEAM